MTYTARQVLEAFYDAERKFTAMPADEADPSEMLSCMSEDLKLYMTEDLPWSGTWRGREGFTKCFGEITQLFDKIDVQPHTILEKEDTIVVLSNATYRIRRTQDEFTKPLSQTFTIDLKEGKIASLRTFMWDVSDTVKRAQQ